MRGWLTTWASPKHLRQHYHPNAADRDDDSATHLEQKGEATGSMKCSHAETTAQPLPIPADLDSAASTPSQTLCLGLLAAPRSTLGEATTDFLCLQVLFRHSSV